MSQQKEQTFKQIMESPAYANQKAIISGEVNHLTQRDGFAAISLGNPGRVDAVDYSVFHKTKEQKLELKVIKHNHKIVLRKHYGAEYKKYLNTPGQLAN